MQTRAIFVQASAIELAHIAERSRKSQEIKLAWIAECSRHSEKGNLLYEGQRPVACVCVLRARGAWHFCAVGSKMPNVLIVACVTQGVALGYGQ